MSDAMVRYVLRNRLTGYYLNANATDDTPCAGNATVYELSRIDASAIDKDSLFYEWRTGRWYRYAARVRVPAGSQPQ